MFTNPFEIPNEDYKRDLNIIKGYRRDSAKYLQLMTGRPLKDCEEFVKEETQVGQHLIDPPSLITQTDENGDRQLKEVTFLKFLGRVVKNNLLLAPSLAVYKPETIAVSTHSQYIFEGVANRAKVKKEALEAKQAGNELLFIAKNADQNTLKINNNSYSGATCSPSTVLFFKSTHSALTSTCRVATSYANAANEKFIEGNRHYYNPDITIENLIAITTNTNMAKIHMANGRFNLYIPTADDVLECVRHSSDLYWQDEKVWSKIHHLASNMSEQERCAVVYGSDLYHLFKHNSEFVTKLLLKLSSLPETIEEVSDEEFNGYNEDVQMTANFICHVQVAGRKLKDIKKDEPETYKLVKTSAKRIMETITEFKLLISAYWTTPVLPSSVYAVPTIYRKAVIVSDTDSTMFTLMHWVIRCYGELKFDADAVRLASALVFLISGMVYHILAQFSATMGVAPDKLRLLAMKNEYYFKVLAMTSRSKHYFASQDAQEGTFFSKPNKEVKGVGLRDSKVPPIVNKKANELMDFIIDSVKAGKRFSIKEILVDIANLEREIFDSLQKGEMTYLTTGQVKKPSSYKLGEDATGYMHRVYWDEIFGDKYGASPPLPYSTVKVNLIGETKTELAQWGKAMNDGKLQENLAASLKKNNRNNLNTLMIPVANIEGSGVPKEIIAGMDMRKIVFGTVSVFYLILETLGIYLTDKKIRRLVSDYY